MFSPIQLVPSMDSGTLSSAINNNFKQIESENRTKVIRDEDGIDRVIMGRYPDGKYGIKVSKPGVDVLTAEDDELIFNSNNNIFKIVETDTITLASPAGTGTSSNVVVPHSLGYKPLVLAFVSFSSLGTSFPLPYNEVDIFTGVVGWQVGMEVTDIDITFFHRNITVASSVTDYIRYYILQETASAA